MASGEQTIKQLLGWHPSVVCSGSAEQRFNSLVLHRPPVAVGSQPRIGPGALALFLDVFIICLSVCLYFPVKTPMQRHVEIQAPCCT